MGNLRADTAETSHGRCEEPARSTTVSKIPSPRRRLRLLVAAFAAAAAVAFGAAVALPVSETAIHLDEGLSSPSIEHPMGQDKLGRDVFARVLAGARVSLAVAASVVAVSACIGVTLGAVAGFAGGWTDLLLMRLVDVLLAFPGLLLAIALAGALGPGFGKVVLALSLLGWTSYARVVRGEVRRLRALDHVEAARALGATPLGLLGRHILPLVAAPVVVQAAFGAASAVVAEASLSFLGLGVQPPQPSWGSMLAEARSFVAVAPHLVVAPGLAISALVLALQWIGDELRDALDVRRGTRSDMPP